MSLILFTPKRFSDPRGWFSETFRHDVWQELGIIDAFVQDNQSLSKPQGTLRGLHFQLPPKGQAKLVRCLRGSLYDVAVDLRAGSPTYGQWLGAEISAENGRQLYIPVGFAHGFVTLEPDTDVLYKVTSYYAPDCDRGLAWDDPTIGIDWPLGGRESLLSDKDTAPLPMMAFRWRYAR
jgi:dTDP-4-dehydrorhamnose 3,5-epimerase